MKRFLKRLEEELQYALSLPEVFPLEKAYEKQFLDFLDRDRILHIFTIFDLRYQRDKTRVWMAFENNEIISYLMEFDKRIVHTHGDAVSVAKLLDFINLDEAMFVIEPIHLQAVEKCFEIVERTDYSSSFPKAKIMTYLVMKVDAETFKPWVKHPVGRLGTEDLDNVLKSMGDELSRQVNNAIQRGFAFGIYENESLVSIATTSNIVDDLALIRGVYTIPSSRGKGLATSTCSALVEELIDRGKKAILWVSKDNLPAIRVYEKIGFKKTDHILLAFQAIKK